jgi:hypothetical protein
MNPISVDRSVTSYIGLSCCLLLPSTDTVHKYCGSLGVAVYLLVGLCLLCAVIQPMQRFMSAVTERQAQLLVLITLIVLLLIVAIVYPIANSGFIGGGSDVDESLDIGVNELLHGRYPYYVKTYLGNSIAMLPGALILAAPFVLLGHIAYQNVFWLSVYIFITRYYLRRWAPALATLWLILAFSPSVMQNIVTATDHPANAIYVMTSTWLTAVTVSDSHVSKWKKVFCAVFLGICLSSRSNFILVTPLLFSAVAQNAGWKTTFKYATITSITLGSVTLPWWLYDPQGFTPLIVQSRKVAQFQSLLPFAGVIIPVASACAALALGTRRMKIDCIELFKNCAIAQAIPVLCVVMLTSVQSMELNPRYAGYGVFALFFGVLPFWREIIESHKNAPKL